MSDCSSEYAGESRSSTSVFDNPSMLSKAFNGSGSDKEQKVPARSNQVVLDLQLLSYFCI